MALRWARTQRQTLDLLHSHGRRSMFDQQFPHCSVNRVLHLKHQVVGAGDKADDRGRGSPSSSKRLRDVKRSVFLSCRRYKLCSVFDELASIVRRPLREASLSLHASFPWLAWLSNVKSRTEQKVTQCQKRSFQNDGNGASERSAREKMVPHCTFAVRR